MADQYSRKEFLDALFHTYAKENGGFIMVKNVNHLDAKTSVRYYPKTDALSREQYSDEHDVFFGTCPRERMKPGKEHIKYITSIWAALDIGPDGYSGKEKHFASDKQAQMAVKNLELSPSIIVRSGRGMHLYWLLEKPEQIEDPSEVESLLRRMSDYFQCKSEVGLDSALRMPGTNNSKYVGERTPCYIEHMDSQLRYRIKNFADLDLRIIIPSKRRPVLPQFPPLPPSRVRVIRKPEEIPTVEIESSASVSVAEPYEVEVDRDTVARDQPDTGKPSTHDLSQQLAEVFSDQLLDELADRIVEKLVTRLGGIIRKDQ